MKEIRRQWTSSFFYATSSWPKGTQSGTQSRKTTHSHSTSFPTTRFFPLPTQDPLPLPDTSEISTHNYFLFTIHVVRDLFFFFFLLSKWKRGITTLLHLANRVFSKLTRHRCVKMNSFIGCTQGQTRATWRLEFYKKLIRVSGLYVTWVLMNLKKYWIFKIPSVNTHACSSQKDFICLHSNFIQSYKRTLSLCDKPFMCSWLCTSRKCSQSKRAYSSLATKEIKLYLDNDLAWRATNRK